MMTKGAKRFTVSESNPDSAFRNKRIVAGSSFDANRAEPAGSSFDANRAEPSQGQSTDTPPLDAQRAASSRQHVRALNTQFASWVQAQLKNHPDELWEDGVRDYLAHASNILDKFSDVVNWLKVNAAKGENSAVAGSFTTAENKMVLESTNNESKLFKAKSMFLPVGATNSFATSWSSGVFSNNHSCTGIFPSSQSTAGTSSNSQSSSEVFSSQSSSGVFSTDNSSVVSGSKKSSGVFSTESSSGIFGSQRSTQIFPSSQSSEGVSFNNQSSSGVFSSHTPLIFSSSQSPGLSSNSQSSGLLSSSQSSGSSPKESQSSGSDPKESQSSVVFYNSQSSPKFSDTPSFGLFSNGQSSGLSSNSQSSAVFSITPSFGLFSNSQSSGLSSNSPPPSLFGLQSSVPTKPDASDEGNEDDLEQPSSPSVKKSEEEGVVAVHEVKCKLYVKSSDPADKDAWKDKGTGQLSVKCKEGVSKGTKESKPTIIVRNDVGRVQLNALLYSGIKTNLQKNSVVAIFHTAAESDGNDGINKDSVVARTFLIRLKTEEDRNKLATAIQEYAPAS